MKLLVSVLSLLMIILIGESTIAGPRVLMTVAHRDDEYMIKGTIKMWQHLGAEFYILYITRGEGGQYWVTENGQPKAIRVSPEEMARISLIEQFNANEAMGIKGFKVIGEPDTPLRDHTGKPTRSGNLFLKQGIWNQSRVEKEIIDYANVVNPDVVITMSLDAGTHGHHKAVRLITEKLWRYKKLGKDANTLLAMDEGTAAPGAKERRGFEIANNVNWIHPTFGKTAAQLGSEAAQNYQSQIVAISQHEQREVEKLYVVGGSWQNSFGSQCGAVLSR